MNSRFPARVLTAALLAAVVCAAFAAGASAGPENRRPFGSEPDPVLTPVKRELPPGFAISRAQALEAAETSPVYAAEREQSGPLRARVFAGDDGNVQISYYDDAGGQAALFVVDGSSGELLEAWRDHQVEVRLARGYEGAVGGKTTAVWVWIPLCALFFFAFFDRRRPWRLLHLDLLVLLSFSASQYFFNRGEITTSVPLVYPVLAYLFLRLLAAGIWPKTRPGPLVPAVPVKALAVAIVVLVGFRAGLAITDDNVIDIGFAGVVGADRIASGEGIYEGKFTPLIDRGDSYGPLNYLAYVPFEQAIPWERGTAEGLGAAKAASITFDLFVVLALLALGARLRERAFGIALAFAWVAYPYSAYALVSDSNDALVAAFVLGALLVLASPVARGLMIAAGAAAKFGPLALAPMFAAGDGQRRWRALLPFSLAFVALWALVLIPLLPDGGLREFYDRSFGYQASRGSPFSVWGLEPSLDWLQKLARAFPVVLGAAFFFLPRFRPRPQLAALAAALLIATQVGSTHWFYFFIAWWAPLALVALFSEQESVTRSSSAARRAAAS